MGNNTHLPADSYPAELRASIGVLAAGIATLPQVEPELAHYFAHHVYGRALRIPADVIAVGKIHKYSQINILAQGEISVSTEQGMLRVKAPYIMSSPAGTQRVVHTHTECLWVTVHGTELTDLAAIEEAFICTTEQEYLAFVAQQQLKGE